MVTETLATYPIKDQRTACIFWRLAECPGPNLKVDPSFSRESFTSSSHSRRMTCSARVRISCTFSALHSIHYMYMESTRGAWAYPRACEMGEAEQDLVPALGLLTIWLDWQIAAFPSCSWFGSSSRAPEGHFAAVKPRDHPAENHISFLLAGASSFHMGAHISLKARNLMPHWQLIFSTFIPGKGDFVFQLP